MPDENGKPLPGEDGYVAYEESLQNPPPSTPETIDEIVDPVEETNPEIVEEMPESVEQADPPIEETTAPSTPEPAEEPISDEALSPDPRHVNSFESGFYFGSDKVNPDNELLEHAGEDYDTNKNKENI